MCRRPSYFALPSAVVLSGSMHIEYPTMCFGHHLLPKRVAYDQGSTLVALAQTDSHERDSVSLAAAALQYCMEDIPPITILSPIPLLHLLCNALLVFTSTKSLLLLDPSTLLCPLPL